MPTAEEKLLDEAIKGTEEEIFGAAFGQDGTVDQTDDDADKSLEEMEDDQSDTTASGEDDASNDEAGAGDEDADGDADGEGEGEKPGAEQPRDKEGKFADKGEKPDGGEQREKPQKGDPAVPLRVERQKAAKLETELEAERRERATERETFRNELSKLEGRLDQVLKGQTAQPKAETKSEAAADAEPDIFVDPDGWRKWNNEQSEKRLSAVRDGFENRFLQASFEDAAEKHGKAFEAAYGALSSLDPQNPAHRAIVNTIRSAPNPGKRLMTWHRQQETLRQVGEDPDAYVERMLAEKLADPEFLKSLLAKVGNAGGDGGGQQQQQQRGSNVRHIIRNPRSLNSEGGRAQSANDTAALDGSEQAVFAAAWK